MPDMLARFWKRSQRAQIESLEREALHAAKAIRKAEIAYFADDESKDKCQVWVNAQNEFERAVDALMEFEDQK